MTTPGTRWVARNGRHAGTEVEVVGTTSGDRVQIRHVGGAGASWSKAKSEASGPVTLGRDVFLATYVQKDQLVAGNTRGGGSFRRNGAAAVAARQDTMDRTLDMPIVADLKEAAQARERPRDKVAVSGLHIEVMLVTPDMARGWLDRGGANRKLSERRVRKYEAIIRRGEWKLNGETIKLDSESRVRDGQHRLEAIYRAGQTVEAIVIRNVGDEAFDTIDTGASRSAADVLSIHGYGNRISLAAMARTLITIQNFGRYTTRGPRRDNVITPSSVLAYVQEHPEMEDTLRQGYILKNAGLAGGAGIWAGALELLRRKDQGAYEVFVEKLHTGAGLEADDPILRLRNRVFTEKQTKTIAQSEAGREYLIAVIIKAWNAWRAGEQMKQLTWHGQGDKNPEPFPVPE